jgi:hypothetical protein
MPDGAADLKSYTLANFSHEKIAKMIGEGRYARP